MLSREEAIRVTETPLRAFVPDRLWLCEYGVRYGGMDLEARTTVVRLANGDLFVHSPGPLEPALQRQVAELGRVAHIVAPGTFHHYHVRTWADAHPEAQVWLCPGLRRKRPGLPAGRELSDEAPPAWRDEIEQVVLRGARVIAEVLFFDRSSRTLIVTDSIEYYGDRSRNVPWLLRLWWVLFRKWNRPSPAPEYGMGFRDRGLARRCLEHALGWDFERIVLSHGDLIERDGHAQAARAWRHLVPEPVAPHVSDPRAA